MSPNPVLNVVHGRLRRLPSEPAATSCTSSRSPPFFRRCPHATAQPVQRTIDRIRGCPSTSMCPAKPYVAFRFSHGSSNMPSYLAQPHSGSKIKASDKTAEVKLKHTKIVLMSVFYFYFPHRSSIKSSSINRFNTSYISPTFYTKLRKEESKG